MTFLEPLAANPVGYLLRDARTGTVLARHLEIARDSRSRRRGLLGRDHLDAGHAMIIVPCASIHMFFMRFAIDVLFVTKEGRVVKCVHEVKPWRLAAALKAFAAIELPAGTLRRCGTRRGDHLVLERAGDEGHCADPNPAGTASQS